MDYICRLPNEVMLEVICMLPVGDIISLRMTCQKFYALTRLRSVWHVALHQHVIAKGLPVPSLYPIAGERYLSASSFDIESRTVHATRLHDNFTSVHPGPRVRRAIKIGAVAESLEDDLDASACRERVSSVAFMNTASGHHYLVAVFGLYYLECWEISSDGASVYWAAVWMSAHPIRRIKINELAECLEHNNPQGLLAVACENQPGMLEVTILGLNRFRGCFINMGTIEVGDASWLHFFRGSLLGTSEPCHVVHWQDGTFFQLQMESVDVDWGNTVDMSILDDHSLLIITHTAIALFLIPSNQPPFSHLLLTPVARFDFPFRVVTLSTAVTGYNLQANDINMTSPKPLRRQPLSVLIRSLDSGFYVIHHYVFDLETPSQPGGHPPAIPLRFPPIHIRTIPTLPSCSTIHVSPSGRGFWLETRNVGPKTHSYPARCVVPFYISAMSTRPVAPDLPEEWQVDFRVGAKNLYERPCGWKDLLDGRQRISSIALDDSMGRVAVGDMDGGIIVLNYV